MDFRSLSARATFNLILTIYLGSIFCYAQVSSGASSLPPDFDFITQSASFGSRPTSRPPAPPTFLDPSVAISIGLVAAGGLLILCGMFLWWLNCHRRRKEAKRVPEWPTALKLNIAAKSAKGGSELAPAETGWVTKGGRMEKGGSVDVGQLERRGSRSV